MKELALKDENIIIICLQAFILHHNEIKDKGRKKGRKWNLLI